MSDTKYHKQRRCLFLTLSQIVLMHVIRGRWSLPMWCDAISWYYGPWHVPWRIQWTLQKVSTSSNQTLIYFHYESHEELDQYKQMDVVTRIYPRLIIFWITWRNSFYSFHEGKKEKLVHVRIKRIGWINIAYLFTTS